MWPESTLDHMNGVVAEGICTVRSVSEEAFLGQGRLWRVNELDVGGETGFAVDARKLYRELGLRKGWSAWTRQWTESGEWFENVLLTRL